MDKKFNNQFATQKLRQETSATNFGGATFTPGTGEQMATNKAFKKKTKKEVKDVEPKLAAGKAKIYMKDKWGWKDAPSVPNRPSKGIGTKSVAVTHAHFVAAHGSFKLGHQLVQFVF